MGVLINEDRFGGVALPLDVASVAASTSVEQTFTCPGLLPGDFVFVSKPSLTAGLGVSTARVTAPGVIGITFDNNTTSPIDPAVETYLLFVYRAEKTTVGRFNVG